MDNRIKALCDFLDAAHSVYHAAAYIGNTLNEAGYTRLYEQDAWELVPGGKYYIIRGGASVIAFRLPEAAPKGFLMSACHSDRPTFKVKENLELPGAYTRVAVEPYGGILLSPWMDRPLSIAGRLTVETEDGVETKLLDIDRDLLLMPNVAIHMNRTVNDGHKWNPAVDTIPLAGSKSATGKLAQILEQEAGGKILGHDLYLYVRQKTAIWGLEEEFISSAALDDLECAWGCTQGFLKADANESINVLCVFDAEEVGSRSVQGAASTFLPDVLGRICENRNLDLKRLIAQSFMISADNAHAMHPNHPELADPAHAPLLGAGVVIKHNVNLNYCTDGVSSSIFQKVCAKAGVPVQSYHNRSDIRGGSTLGRISLGKISLPTVDIGLPQLAMHSCYETGATADVIYLEEAMTAYYSRTLEARGDNWILN